MATTRAVVKVPAQVAARWGVPHRLEVGDVGIWLDAADAAARGALLAAQSRLVDVDPPELDAEAIMVGGLRFELWQVVAEPAGGTPCELAVLVSHPFGPTGWVPDAEGDAAVLEVLADSVGEEFSGAELSC